MRALDDFLPEYEFSERHSIEIGATPDRIDEALRHAFAQQTCNGCHAQETFSMQGFFHVSPFKPVVPGGNGQDRVSVFLKRDDLPRRVSRMQELLR